jgi:ABC-type xylose transport system permease subunit
MHELKLQNLSGALAGASTVMGFAAPMPHVIAGLFFAVAGGFVGMTVSPPTERLALPITVMVALVIGIFAGLAHPHFAAWGAMFAWISTLPIQLVMGVAGLASPWLARRIAAGDMSLPWKGNPK